MRGAEVGAGRAQAWPEKEAIAEQLREHMRRRGLARAFLATDGAAEERAWLLAAVPGLVAFEPAAGEELMEAEAAIVDQARLPPPLPPLDPFPPIHGPRAAQGERRRRARGRAQVVAGRAAFFLGNVWSTFSWAIVEERWARLGAQEDSNALQQAPFSPQELAARGPVRVLR